MNLLYSSQSTTTLIVFVVFYTLFRGATSEKVTAELYRSGKWRDSNGCADLQLNLSASSIIAGDKMHLFGNVNDLSNTSAMNFAIEVLIGSIDLKKAFTVDEYEIEWRTSPNFTFDPYFISGDESRLLFAGEHRTKFAVSTVGSSLISFDPTNWELETTEWPAVITEGSLPRYSLAHVNVPEVKMTYYAGAQPSTGKSFDNELFAYNYSDGSMTRHKAPNKAWASVIYVPAGAKGMLVTVGGTERSDLSTPIAMDEIHVYDIDNDTWYLQPTTGKTPSDRMNNCAVVTAASDGSSYQIHVYGGVRPEDQSYQSLIDNYYILSVPQFIWTKGPNLPVPRSSPSCNLLGNHRMVISAGFVSSTCVPLIQILDLNTGNITESFSVEDTSKYQVPGFIVSDIGGGSAAPANGFVGGLDKAWAKPYTLGENSTTPADDTDESSGSSKKTPLGAIIGGTLGGVAGCTLILCGILYWRRRAARQPENAALSTPVASTNPDHAYPAGEYSTDPKDTYPTYTPTGYPSPSYTTPTSPAPTYTTPTYPGGIEEIGGGDVVPAASEAHELPGHPAKW